MTDQTDQIPFPVVGVLVIGNLLNIAFHIVGFITLYGTEQVLTVIAGSFSAGAIAIAALNGADTKRLPLSQTFLLLGLTTNLLLGLAQAGITEALRFLVPILVSLGAVCISALIEAGVKRGEQVIEVQS